MLHNIDDNATPTATLTSATATATATTTTTTTETTTAAAATTTTMAPTETTGNGTEPTISTHLALNATPTIEPTTRAATTNNTAAAPNASTEQERIAATAAASACLATTAAEGQTITTTITTTTTLTANNTKDAGLLLPTSTAPATAPLPLSAVAEMPELAKTADVSAATAVAVADDVAAAAAAGSAAAATVVRVEPTAAAAFDVQMRTQQQQKIKIYHGAKQSAVWRTDSLASNSSSNRSDAGSTETVVATRSSAPASTAPSLLQRKFSDGVFTGAAAMPRRVSFPESVDELVTGYLEPANPWEQVCVVTSVAEITDLYLKSCTKHGTKPLKNVLDHLKTIDLHLTRQPLLSLKAIQFTPNDCEPLEEIFKRIQYKAIDLSECPLNESCLNALCQMIEYYEAANELDISYNKEPMSVRAWGLCTNVVGRSQELQQLNAEGNQISKVGAENLGSALSTSNLHTIKLEHCGLRGAPLTNFCCKLYHNKILKELWLGYNDLDCTDAQHLADMLRFNHSIELMDISNNNIRDEGVMYLVQALIMQATEMERRSGLPLQRARAIEDDEPVSPLGAMLALQAQVPPPCSSSSQLLQSVQEQEACAAPTVVEVKPVEQPQQLQQQQQQQMSQAATEETGAPAAAAATTATTATLPAVAAVAAAEEPSSTNEPAVALLVDLENDADDDNTEDTVRTLRSGGNHQSASGQSMLDKLLSMNSDSSSEEAPSNISTDTLAACCSEDISEISMDNLPAAATATTTATATVELDTTPALEPAKLDSVAGTPEQLTPEQQQQQQQQSSQNERNLCDITPSTEAKTVEPNETCVQNNNNNANSHNNNNNNNQNQNNSNNIHNNNQQQQQSAEATAGAVGSSGAAASIYEVTAEESDCINGEGVGAAVGGSSGSRPLDMNKNNAKNAGDDFEDTHSTDSAFESASEGDISRHLPEEFSRLSVSLESTRLEMPIETATIASESTECLLVAEEEEVAAATTTTTARAVHAQEQTETKTELYSATTTAAPKVTIAAECLTSAKEKELSESPCPSPTPTPPPPSTSPGGVSSGLRRVETSCAYLNQSTRNRSQSSDSLCSENSLDSSASATDTAPLAEKLTKNDTLSRRQLGMDATIEAANRPPSGLKALALWSNNLTKDCGGCISDLLSRTTSLELLNIGKNCLSNDFVATIKESLIKNQTLTTLGLQSAHLSAKGIETLASILTFGGNSKLQRIDIRDNKLEVESLNIIAEVLKSNKTITQIDINDEPKRLTLPIVPIVNVTPPTPLPQESIGSDAHLDYTRVLGTVRSMCSRNEKMQAEQLELAEKAANVGGGGSSSSINSGSSSNGNNAASSSHNGSNGDGSSNNRCRIGYYMGSRKISLTCHSRPLVDVATGTVTAGALAVTAMPTPAAKLEVKRKSNTRLRSPGPSPPTVSPSSSPNRSRFHVSRVTEIGSPLTSPLAQMPPQHPPPTPRSASSCMSIPTASGGVGAGGGGGGGATNGVGGIAGGSGLLGSQSSLNSVAALPLPTSSSLPSMASVTSSTQTIKRLSVSPRSRFHVSRIYEDPQTPPIHLPPTPMLKSARKAAEAARAAVEAEANSLSSNTAAATSTATTTTTMPISSVIIVEPGAAAAPVALATATAPPTASTPPTAIAENDNAHEKSTNEAHKLSPASTSSSSCSSSPSSSSSTSTGSSSSSSSNTCSYPPSSSSCSADGLDAPLMARSCPIAVFGDNDITLTKDSVASVALSAAASNNSISESTLQPTPAAAAAAAAATVPAATRARKSSWIANPTTVDKLLTLFNPSTMFQRSSSPETKAAQPATSATILNNAQTNISTSGDINVTLVPTRKTTPPSRSNSNATTGATGAAGGGGAGATAETAAGGISFLDTATVKLRDFGKQVFRQNLSFNNSGDGIGNSSSAAGAAAEAQQQHQQQQLQQQQLDINTTGASFDSPLHMPLSLKRELKENISPEHTINEETLHSLQKISRNEDVALKAEAAAELGDIEIVMHSEVSDCMQLPEAGEQDVEKQLRHSEDLGQV